MLGSATQHRTLKGLKLIDIQALVSKYEFFLISIATTSLNFQLHLRSNFSSQSQNLWFEIFSFEREAFVNRKPYLQYYQQSKEDDSAASSTSPT